MCFVIDDLIEVGVAVLVTAAYASPYLAAGAIVLEGGSIVACLLHDPELASVLGTMSQVFGVGAAIGGVGSVVTSLADQAINAAAQASAGAFGSAVEGAGESASAALSSAPITFADVAQMSQFMTSFGSLGLELSGQKEAAGYLGMFSGMANGALGLLGEATGALDQSSLVLAQKIVGAGSSAAEFKLTADGSPEEATVASYLGMASGAADSALGFVDMATQPARPSVKERVESLSGGLVAAAHGGSLAAADYYVDWGGEKTSEGITRPESWVQPAASSTGEPGVVSDSQKAFMESLGGALNARDAALQSLVEPPPDPDRQVGSALSPELLGQLAADRETPPRIADNSASYAEQDQALRALIDQTTAARAPTKSVLETGLPAVGTGAILPWPAVPILRARSRTTAHVNGAWLDEWCSSRVLETRAARVAVA